MQIRNNYDLEWHKDGEPGAGVFNGDIGKILTLQKKTGEAVVCFDGRTAVYSFDQLEQLELAYAITVHKSQGCEFEVVILPFIGWLREVILSKFAVYCRHSFQKTADSDWFTAENLSDGR